MVRPIVDVVLTGLGWRYQLKCGHHVAAPDYRPPAKRNQDVATTCKPVAFCPTCWLPARTQPTGAA